MSAPVVRLKGDRIVLKLGTETCELSIEEARYLSRTLVSRANESQGKKDRDPERMAAWADDWDRNSGERNRRWAAIMERQPPS